MFYNIFTQLVFLIFPEKESQKDDPLRLNLGKLPQIVSAQSRCYDANDEGGEEFLLAGFCVA